ncbi:unnamed protein product [Schistocephalus solidus]|uniref:Zf-C2H2_2 domain-containing protein n=1 Tax=Schistocephalus solidus TaxID=70667 RepID=A0A183TQU6_SCHSO|nr:unnamed protein product [Schistocephalus solidus]
MINLNHNLVSTDHYILRDDGQADVGAAGGEGVQVSLHVLCGREVMDVGFESYRSCLHTRDNQLTSLSSAYDADPWSIIIADSRCGKVEAIMLEHFNAKHAHTYSDYTADERKTEAVRLQSRLDQQSFFLKKQASKASEVAERSHSQEFKIVSTPYDDAPSDV